MEKMPKNKRVRANKGFTALELMVTIGIIAIIAAIGVPAYTNWVPKYKLSGDVANLKADLEMAKLTAKRENITIGVLFKADDYTIFRDKNDPPNHAFDANESVVEYQKLSPGNKFPSTGVLTWFQGNGEANATDITLQGYGGTGNKVIRVELLGRIRIL